MNGESSRSHLILTICVDIISKTGDEVTFYFIFNTNNLLNFFLFKLQKRSGKISLVDLAGSERVSKSNLSVA